MKTETSDLLMAGVKISPGLFGTAVTMDLLIGIFTFIFVLLQIAYLVRKWWREETEWGRRLKRWAERKGITQPMPLDGLEPDE